MRAVERLELTHAEAEDVRLAAHCYAEARAMEAIAFLRKAG